MHGCDNNVWLVFNGEIFNYLELREELVARGHQVIGVEPDATAAQQKGRLGLLRAPSFVRLNRKSLSRLLGVLALGADDLVGGQHDRVGNRAQHLAAHLRLALHQPPQELHRRQAGVAAGDAAVGARAVHDDARDEFRERR